MKNIFSANWVQGLCMLSLPQQAPPSQPHLSALQLCTESRKLKYNATARSVHLFKGGWTHIPPPAPSSCPSFAGVTLGQIKQFVWYHSRSFLSSRFKSQWINYIFHLECLELSFFKTSNIANAHHRPAAHLKFHNAKQWCMATKIMYLSMESAWSCILPRSRYILISWFSKLWLFHITTDKFFCSLFYQVKD